MARETRPLPVETHVVRRSVLFEEGAELGEVIATVGTALAATGHPVGFGELLRAQRECHSDPDVLLAACVLGAPMSIRRVGRADVTIGLRHVATGAGVLIARVPWWESPNGSLARVSNGLHLQVSHGQIRAQRARRHVVIVGYVPDRGVRILNARGATWGDLGRCWLDIPTYRYMLREPDTALYRVMLPTERSAHGEAQD